MDEPSPCLPLTHWLLPRRLAPMRLYTLSKRHFVLVFIVFFVCFGLTVFIGIKGKVQGLVVLSLIGTLVQCFSARPSCTHLPLPSKSPTVRLLGGGVLLPGQPGPGFSMAALDCLDHIPFVGIKHF